MWCPFVTWVNPKSNDCDLMTDDKVRLGEQRDREVCEDGSTNQTDTTINHEDLKLENK